MITTKTRVTPATRSIRANTNVTANVQNRNIKSSITANINLSPEQKAFVRQLQANTRKTQIMAATNTTNIMARPDFMELLPLFVQKLLILDVYGSVAMKSRQQLIPFFKFVAENTKGETTRGDVLSSPFANRQGIDPNFGGRLVKNELNTADAEGNFRLMYTPVLPGSVSIQSIADTTKVFVDKDGSIYAATDLTSAVGAIDYTTGQVSITDLTGDVRSTYQYDNENVGPRAHDNGQFGYDYGAQMGKGYLQLDEINLIAEAHELACYWSIYSAFAAQQEYGANIGDIAKEAAFSELTAEINTKGFVELAKAASYRPQFNWDASPVLQGSVVPSDYLNMFKLKLAQASASVYQATRLSKPNRLVVGSNVASYLTMVQGFAAEGTGETVGPYKVGKLDQFEIYCEPSYDPDLWVMCCKSQDIRRNSALFGEYMPLTNTDALGLANASVQQGYASMYSLAIINAATIVSGRILGTF